MNEITVPIGPGKGRFKPMVEALQSLMWEMRGHVRDLRDSGEIDQADLLERYEAAIELIWEQIVIKPTTGTGLPDELVRKAQKYHLALPVEITRK